MSGSANRQRDYRQRQKAGRAIFPVEQDQVDLVEALRAEGCLTVPDPTNADITAALDRAIARWIEQVKYENA